MTFLIYIIFVIFSNIDKIVAIFGHPNDRPITRTLVETNNQKIQHLRKNVLSGRMSWRSHLAVLYLQENLSSFIVIISGSILELPNFVDNYTMCIFLYFAAHLGMVCNWRPYRVSHWPTEIGPSPFFGLTHFFIWKFNLFKSSPVKDSAQFGLFVCWALQLTKLNFNYNKLQSF